MWGEPGHVCLFVKCSKTTLGTDVDQLSQNAAFVKTGIWFGSSRSAEEAQAWVKKNEDLQSEWIDDIFAVRCWWFSSLLMISFRFIKDWMNKRIEVLEITTWTRILLLTKDRLLAGLDDEWGLTLVGLQAEMRVFEPKWVWDSRLMWELKWVHLVWLKWLGFGDKMELKWVCNWGLK